MRKTLTGCKFPTWLVRLSGTSTSAIAIHEEKHDDEQREEEDRAEACEGEFGRPVPVPCRAREEGLCHGGRREDGEGRDDSEPPDEADEKCEEEIHQEDGRRQPAAERSRGPHDLDDHRQMSHDERRTRERL